MKLWVKIVVAAFIVFIGSLGIIALAAPEHLPFLRETIVSLFSGIAVGLQGFFNGIWVAIEPTVMPNLTLFWVGSLLAFGIFMMYFGHKVTTRMQNFIGIQWRRQAATTSGGSIPMTIGGSENTAALAAGTPSASQLLGVNEPKKEA